MYSVYLLDDEFWQVKSLMFSIDWQAHDVEIIGTQTNSVIALKEILDKNPDILFTDVRMPEMDGLELISKLIESGYRGVVVVLSGHAEYEYVQKALSYNAVAYCLKPFDDNAIIEALDKAKTDHRNRKLLETFKIKKNDESNNVIFGEIIGYINSHFCDDINLQSVAELFYINSSYLSKLFKSEMDVTFTSYLSNLRLERACILLKESRMQVAEVAESVGFSNYFYFARVFKKTYGKTPTEYKQ